MRLHSTRDLQTMSLLSIFSFAKLILPYRSCGTIEENWRLELAAGGKRRQDGAQSDQTGIFCQGCGGGSGAHELRRAERSAARPGAAPGFAVHRGFDHAILGRESAFRAAGRSGDQPRHCRGCAGDRI